MSLFWPDGWIWRAGTVLYYAAIVIPLTSVMGGIALFFETMPVWVPIAAGVGAWKRERNAGSTPRRIGITCIAATGGLAVWGIQNLLYGGASAQIINEFTTGGC